MTDPIDPRVETPEEVRDRVLEAARFIDPSHLGTTDDCGFSPFGDDTSTSRDTAFAKIRARIDGTAMASDELGSLNGRARRPPRAGCGSIRSCGGPATSSSVVVLAVGHALHAAARTAPLRRSTRRAFVEETGAIDHRYAGDFQYFVGGGVAAFDCDDDGRSDLFLAGGSEPAALYHNDSERGGALRFTQLPSPVTDLTAVTGAYPLDIDGDGHTDLVVLRVGEDVVLRGLGDCRFERANESLGIDGGDTWTVAFSATWEGDDALADAGVRRLPRGRPRGVRGQPAAAARRRRRCEYARADRPRRPATARCRCCSATGAGRASATCG